MKKHLMGGTSAKIYDPTFSRRVKKDRSKNIASMQELPSYIPPFSVDTDCSYTLPCTDIVIYNGISCNVTFIIDNTTYTEKCNIINSCIHLDLEKYLGKYKYIDILLVSSSQIQLNCQVSKEVTVTDITYNGMSSKFSNKKLQYVDHTIGWHTTNLADFNAYDYGTIRYVGDLYICIMCLSTNPYIFDVAVSKDGVYFDQIALPGRPDLEWTYNDDIIRYVNGRYVILCNIILYSEDGYNWFVSNLQDTITYNDESWPVNSINGKNVIEKNGLYFCLATSCELPYLGAVSTDLVNWTAFNVSYTADSISFSIADWYDGTMFLYKDGYYYVFPRGAKTHHPEDLYSETTPSNKYFISTDGYNWTEKTMPSFSMSWSSAQIHNRVILVIASTKYDSIDDTTQESSGTWCYTSTDGFNWTVTHTDYDLCNGFHESGLIVWKDYFIVSDARTADNDDCIAYSTDGKNWSHSIVDVADSGSFYASIIVKEDCIVIVNIRSNANGNGYKYAITYNLQTWQTVNYASEDEEDWTILTNSNGKWVVYPDAFIEKNNAGWYTVPSSDDLINWVQPSVADPSEYIQSTEIPYGERAWDFKTENALYGYSQRFYHNGIWLWNTTGSSFYYSYDAETWHKVVKADLFSSFNIAENVVSSNKTKYYFTVMNSTLNAPRYMKVSFSLADTNGDSTGETITRICCLKGLLHDYVAER